jgi:hypothetical protein
MMPLILFGGFHMLSRSAAVSLLFIIVGKTGQRKWQHYLAGCSKEGDEERPHCISNLYGEEAVPPTYQKNLCHLIFDVKMEDLRRKTLFVAGGHTTDTPHAMTHASVVSQESVIISLTLAALNDANVKMADIENAYLTAPITEKVCNVLGP